MQDVFKTPVCQILLKFVFKLRSAFTLSFLYFVNDSTQYFPFLLQIPQ